MYGLKFILKMNIVGFIVIHVKISVILHLFMKKDGKKNYHFVLPLLTIILKMLLGDMLLILNKQYKNEILMKKYLLRSFIELIKDFDHNLIEKKNPKLFRSKFRKDLKDFDLILCIYSQIKDIVSMLNEDKSTKESELHGRQSGSLAWKLSRGETDQKVGYSFQLNPFFL